MKLKTIGDTGRGVQDTVNLSKQGRLIFNQPAIDEYGLEVNQKWTINIDEEENGPKRHLYLVLTPDADEKFVVMRQSGQTALALAATKALKEIGFAIGRRAHFCSYTKFKFKAIQGIKVELPQSDYWLDN